jgi:hypothetical protein
MGFIGKLLVVVHGAASLAVLAWAFGVYTHRIDWNTPPPTKTGPSAPGLFDRQKAQADQYNVAVDKAYARWSGNQFSVLALEGERYPRRAFYQEQLYLVQSGKIAQVGADGRVTYVNVPEPVQLLEYAPNGFLDITKRTGRAPYKVREDAAKKGTADVVAKAIETYERDMVKQLEDIQASQVKNQTAIDAREKLNKEIVGQTVPTVVKGLRTLLAEQKNFHDRASNENDYVVDFVTNREAEFGLLKKRRDAMLARIVELKNAEGKKVD